MERGRSITIHVTMKSEPFQLLAKKKYEPKRDVSIVGKGR